MTNISRRSLLKWGGVAAVGALGAGTLAGCAPQDTDSANSGASLSSTGTEGPSFLAAPDPITDFAETLDFEVIVVGAGAAGVPAALAAQEAGAKVALLQKEDKAVSQGNAAAGIIADESSPAGIQALISKFVEKCDHRADRRLINVWAQNSGEALTWLLDRATAAGAAVSDLGNSMQKPILEVDGYGPMNYLTVNFGPKPYNVGDGMRSLADAAEKAGVQIFYSTPAVQLVSDESGAVTGVVGERGGEHVLFTASKGVIMATGDYQNDEEMCDYFLPDVKHLMRKQTNKTGDGHKMVHWAGGQIEPAPHTKMMHDFDSGPYTMGNVPFPCVNQRGERFVNETVGTSELANYLRSEQDAGWYAQIFAGDYMEYAADWGILSDPDALKNYMPEEPGEKQGVFESLIRTYKADTLEELAEKIDVDPAALVATIDHFNELCAAGADTDLGLPVKYLHPVTEPPFYAIHRRSGISAITSGVMVDENLQCLTPEGEPIGGLFAVGNLAGPFYGGVDYPLTVYGTSLGAAFTEGYVAGRYVAGL